MHFYISSCAQQIFAVDDVETERRDGASGILLGGEFIFRAVMVCSTTTSQMDTLF